MRRLMYGFGIGVLVVLLLQDFLRSAFWGALRGVYGGGP